MGGYGGGYGMGGYGMGGYGMSYNYPGNYAPNISPNYNQGDYAQAPSIEPRQSFYMDPNQGGAIVRVVVPDPNAEIWFDGVATNQRGMDRLYQSPPFDPNGNHYYKVKAKWTDNGRPMEQERQVQIRQGQPAFVDFRGSGNTGEQLNNPNNNNTNPNLPNPNSNTTKPAPKGESK